MLLVDDRPDNLLALQAVLEPLGLDLVEAGSGEEALRHLLAGEFALIVLDVQMPVLDGFETARLIRGRERTRYVPIIFLTAISGEPEHYLRGYQSGAVDYVYKPFEPEILRAKVSVFVELWSRGATIEAQREELAGRLAELDEAHAGLAAQAVELERSNAALERFAEVVGVELREPLHTVAGLLDLLDDRHAGTLSDEGRTLLARAMAGTDRARSIVGSLLDYARASTADLRRDRFPLAEALAEAEAETGPLLAEAKAEVAADGLPGGVRPTGVSWCSCWPSCSTTRPGSGAPRHRWWRCPPNRWPGRCGSRWPTTGPACPRPTFPGCSPPSPGRRRRPRRRATGGAPGSAWPCAAASSSVMAA